MADDPTPEQVAEMQRKNCIFCKIISGEVESRKVFENEHFLAILDIRPATPGHVLLMPKDHVPIMPLLNEERMIEAFNISTQLASAVQEAMIVPKVNVFIASGYAAGQQAPHLILHIIPRDKGDGLEMLDLEKMDTPQADAVALASTFAAATKQALKHRKRDDLLKQHHGFRHAEPHPAEAPPAQPQASAPRIETAVPVDTPAGPALVKAEGTHPSDLTPKVTQVPADKTVVTEPKSETQEFETTSEALEAALAMSPDLRKLVIAQPDLVAEYVQRSPKLSKLFEGVNIRALSLALQRQEAARPQPAQVKLASEMTDDELFRFFDTNEGLRTWVLEHPEELAANIGDNPRLSRFFANVDIVDAARRYKAYHATRRGAA